jgi:hypothetical protein
VYVSIRAVSYVRDLKACEDGAELLAAQKLMLMVLADSHSIETLDAFPGIPRLAEDSLIHVSTAQRYLAYLEKHCTLAILKPERQGAGQFTRFVFLGLDFPEELARRREQVVKGSQFTTLFLTEKRVAEGSQIQGKRVAKGSQIGIRYKEESRIKSNQEPGAGKQVTSAECESQGNREAWAAWRTIAAAMQAEIDPHVWGIWLKPLRPVAVRAGWLHLALAHREGLELVTKRYRDRIQAGCVGIGLLGVILEVAA